MGPMRVLILAVGGLCARLAPGCPWLASFFFFAIARAVVNHDGVAGTSLDPMVWSVGGVPKRRRVVHVSSW